MRSGWEETRRRNQVLERDGFMCVSCGAVSDLEVDHIMPRASGGTNDLSNLQTLCADCHRAKTQTER
jgi:5-methylcytosine-specific restriction protein A